jgi:hypothetical protein
MAEGKKKGLFDNFYRGIEEGLREPIYLRLSIGYKLQGHQRKQVRGWSGKPFMMWSLLSC